jgi:hypothetical protein
MGWLSALGESWGQARPRWEQQRELDRKWQMEQERNAREAEAHKNQQRLVLNTILRNEHELGRLPTLDKQADEMFGLDVSGKRAGIRQTGIAADTGEFNLGRSRQDAGREDQFYQWMTQNPGAKPEEVLMVAARFGVDPTRTAGVSAKLNTDLQREQIRSNAIIAAAQARGPYGGGRSGWGSNGMGGYGPTVASDYTEPVADQIRRTDALQTLKKTPTSLSELMELRAAANAKQDEPQTPEALNAKVGNEWTGMEDKVYDLMGQAAPDMVMGGGIGGAEGVSPKFSQTMRNLASLVGQNGAQNVIDNIADDPGLSEDEKEMLRQQVLVLGPIFGQPLDPNYRPKVYREPYGAGPQGPPPVSFNRRYSPR